MKKLISILCSLTMLAGCGVNTFIANAEETTTSTEVSDILIGDANNDGNIDLNDAVKILVDYAFILTYGRDENREEKEGYITLMSNKAEDVDSDGKINAIDALAILKYYGYKMVYPDTKLTLTQHHEIDFYGTEEEKKTFLMIEEYPEDFNETWSQFIEEHDDEFLRENYELGLVDR